MRKGLENWLLGHWYSRQVPPWYLRMLEPLYRSAYSRAQKRQQARPFENKTAAALIIVGNITAGGSGKTPLVIRLCELALEAGLRAGIASTGFGRQSRETVHVHADSDSSECGDEPVLLAQRTGVPVVVAKHRLDAIKTLNETDIDLIISDDGLQHNNLGVDIEICVVDGQRGLGNGHLIPAGPLREPEERLAKVDHVVSNGTWKHKPGGLSVHEMHLKAVFVKTLDNSKDYLIKEFQEEYGGRDIHAFAGIGNPSRFFKMLRELGFEVSEHAFADHHKFSEADFSVVASGALILMTEKDAVKCRSLALENAWFIPVETHLPVEFERIINQQLIKLTQDRQT